MTTINEKEVLVLVKKEVTEGTDAVPTGVANAIATNSFSLKPAEKTEVKRDLDRPGRGASPSLIHGIHGTTSFKVEMQTSGVLGTRPAYGDLLLASQFAETITAITSVEYDPVSAAQDSATLYAYLDTILHKLTSWRGAMGLEMTAGAVPYFTFSGMGLWTQPSDEVLPAADFSSQLAPETVSKEATLIADFMGFAMPLVGFSVGDPSNVTYRNLPNQEAIRASGERGLTGQVEFLMSSIAGFDPYAALQAASLSALQIVHGSTAAKKVQVDAPKVQITGVDMGSSEGERTYKLDLLLTAGDSGDDDLKLTFI